MSDIITFTSFHNIIDGEPRDSETTHHGVNPATRDPLWDAPTATEQDVNDAVHAADKAFQTWKETPFRERVQVLKAWGEACRPYLKEFGELIMKENGKPVG
jgi:acyl-CoA reductase-like NAD-dependent aldehyde dehydrogenase